MATHDTEVGYHALKREAESFLKENPVVRLEQLEDHLYQKFHAEWESGAYDKVNGNRPAWKNLVDWVKANLTKEEKTRYYNLMGTKLLAYVPDAGFIHGVGRIYTGQQLFTLLNSMAKVAQQIGYEKEAEEEKVEMSVDEYFNSK